MPRSSSSGGAGTSFRSQTLAQPGYLVASARNLGKLPDISKRANIRSKTWQKTAFKFLHLVGEYRYACQWVGNQLSKAKLTVLENGEETTNQAALDALASLYGGPDGQSEMFSKLGVHLTVTGDSLIFGVPKGEPGSEEMDEWCVASPTTTTVTGTKWRVGPETIYEDPMVIRIWESDFEDPAQAASPSRAVLLILEELFGLTQRIQAQILSRLASAGLLVIPTETTFGTIPVAKQEGADPDETTETSQATVNDFINTLVQVAMTSMENREDASALVPVVIQVAGEYVDKIKHIDWASALDKMSVELRKEAINRLALGMDMPPEILTGVSDTNHWNAWQVEEAAIKVHAEPKLATIARGLTTGYLRPVMASLDPLLTKEQLANFTFGIDSTGLRIRPNRSKEAMELYDRGKLSAAALLRENGFDPTGDAMPAEEFKTWLLTKMATGQTTPELVAVANRLLGVAIPTIAATAPPVQGRPTPTKENHPVNELPARVDDPVAAAAGVLVQRALERAGNRKRTKMAGVRINGATAATLYQFVSTTEAEVDELLTDAWGWVDPLAEQYGVDAAELTEQLHSYTRQLLLTQKPHSPALLAAHLAVSKAVA